MTITLSPKSKQVAILLLVPIFLAPGCKTPSPTPQQLNSGLIYMFPGIEGGDWSLNQARKAFRDAGAQAAIYTYQWKYPFLPLANLMDYNTNTKAAAQVAQQIADYHQQYPNTPIDLVGYSGGGGLAILTAQQLPPNVKLRNVVLVHAALSPNYNLTPALKNINGNLVNFHSNLDWVILGLGTNIFGTIDRTQTDSAGKVGFDPNLAIPDPQLRTKFTQHQWSKQMLKKGHLGGHTTIMFYNWNKQFIAPYLLPTQPPE